MRGSWWMWGAVLCVGCGSPVNLGGSSHNGVDAGTHNGAGGSSAGTGGTTGMDAGTAGTSGMTGTDAGTAGTSGTTGTDAGAGCPATVLAQSTFPTQYWGLALDASNVYWFSFDSTGDALTWIEQEPKTGGTPQRLASVPDNPESLRSSGVDLFYAATATGVDHGSVGRVSKSTGNVSKLVGNVMAYDVAANTTTAFFIADLPGGTQAGYELDAVPRAGGSVTTLSSVALDAPFADPAGPVVAGNDVYWIKPGQPSTLENVLATPPATIATGNFIGGIQTLALAGGKLFYLESNGTAALNGGVDVKSVSTTGGPQRTVAQGTNAGDVIADGGDVYFCSHGTYMPSDPGFYKDDGTIQKVSANGGTPVTLVSGLKGGEVPAVYPIAVDATYLYWIENDGMSGYRVMRTCR